MKTYEAPDFTKIEFVTESVLKDSILDPTEVGEGGTVELGKIDLFK